MLSKTNKYKHLQETHKIEFDWENNLLKKSLPPRAFTNELTSNLILACESILVASMKPIRKLQSFYSI